MTTDLISAGTITVVIRQGDVQAAVEYTISKAALPEDAPKATISVPYTCTKITEDLFGTGSNWKVANDFIGMDLPETESVRIKAVYTGADAANYETTMVEVEVQRSHNPDKVNVTVVTKPKTTPASGDKQTLEEQSETAGISSPVLPALIRPIVSKKRKQIISWKKVKGADGYFIYASKCNGKKKIRKLKRIYTISSPEKTSYENKKLKKNTGYKYEVRAYRFINGKKVVFGRSLQLHALTKGSKTYDNPAGVRISGKAEFTLKTGRTKKIKAETVLPKGRKCKWHIAKIRYLVSDTNVVSVSKKGKITAKSPGKAVVYAVTQNGEMAKLKVRVKN